MITMFLLLVFLLFTVVILAPLGAGIAVVGLDLAIAVGMIVGLVKLFTKKKSRN